MGSIQAELTRRKWIDWAENNLPSFAAFTNEMGKQKLAQIRNSRPPSGTARCYEHSEVSFGGFVAAVLAAVRDAQLGTILVVVGDSISPAIFAMGISDLPVLLHKAGSDDSVLTLSSEAGTGQMVLIEVPKPAVDADEMLVSTTGTFEPMLDHIKEALPGGEEFRGN